MKFLIFLYKDIIIIIIIMSCYPFMDKGRQQNVAIWSYFWPAA